MRKGKRIKDGWVIDNEKYQVKIKLKNIKLMKTFIKQITKKMMSFIFLSLCQINPDQTRPSSSQYNSGHGYTYTAQAKYCGIQLILPIVCAKSFS